jgi:hypothetical protein
MARFDSPINEALRAAEYDRLWSIVYSVLNEVVGSKAQRKEWCELGTYHVVQLLVHSARPNWETYPGAFWIEPWTAQLLRSYEPNGLYYIVDNWLQGMALHERISDDPRVEDLKVRHLEQLLSALNRNI